MGAAWRYYWNWPFINRPFGLHHDRDTYGSSEGTIGDIYDTSGAIHGSNGYTNNVGYGSNEGTSGTIYGSSEETSGDMYGCLGLSLHNLLYKVGALMNE